MKRTQHYNLNKPEATVDYFDIEDANSNMDIIDTALNDKVEKIDGKSLSTEDYTTAEKNKLSSVPDDLSSEFASKNHHHNNDYASKVHDHDSLYASKIHDHDSLYAGKSHDHNSVYATSNHNHDGVYEPVIAKKTGFNLNKSDSVLSASSSVLATSKAVKDTYDKTIEVLNKSTELESRISRVENGLFDNITGNPFLVSFDSLNGVVIVKGNWNSTRQRIEC